MSTVAKVDVQAHEKREADSREILRAEKKRLEAAVSLTDAEIKIKDYLFGERTRLHSGWSDSWKPKNFFIPTSILERTSSIKLSTPTQGLESLPPEILVTIIRHAHHIPEQIALALSSKTLASAFTLSGRRLSREMTIEHGHANSLATMLSAWSFPRFRYCKSCDFFRSTDRSFWNEFTRTVTPYQTSSAERWEESNRTWSNHLPRGAGEVQVRKPVVSIYGQGKGILEWVEWTSRFPGLDLTSGDRHEKNAPCWLPLSTLFWSRCPLHDFEWEMTAWRMIRGKDWRKHE